MGLGVPPTHVHTHARMHTHVVNMKISCKLLPPLGESLGIPYDYIHVYACMHMHACVCVYMCGGTL